MTLRTTFYVCIFRPTAICIIRTTKPVWLVSNCECMWAFDTSQHCVICLQLRTSYIYYRFVSLLKSSFFQLLPHSVSLYLSISSLLFSSCCHSHSQYSDWWIFFFVFCAFLYNWIAVFILFLFVLFFSYFVRFVHRLNVVMAVWSARHTA